MTPERYAKLRALYDQVIDLPAAVREARLRELGVPEEAGARDEPAVAEVLAYIVATQPGGPAQLAAIAQPLGALLGELASPNLQPGDVLGAWRVEREIAQGGMGSVFLVSRCDGQYEQRAALKFVKGLGSAERQAHFAAERQLLASLTHPNIARLLDGGRTGSGQPWLVMDYVDGLHIDAWCRRHRPGLDGLLQLFVSACDAVAFAHRQLIVHCDLKPSNVMVDPEGRPVLLDFGIARLIDRIAAGDSAASPGFTPRYASPEQCAGGRIGTASDVYSLGVMLGELLAIGGHADAELAAIVQRATLADAAARYPGVDALVEDIHRYRAHLPLRALPARGSYRLRKYWQRRWPSILAAAAFGLTVAGFTAKVLVESQRAQRAEQSALRERDQAARERDRATEAETSARQTADFLVSVFEAANPERGIVDIPAAQLIAEAEARLEVELQAQPARRSEIHGALARVQTNLNDMERARMHFERAIELERPLDRPLTLARLLHDSAAQRRRSRGSFDAEAEAREAYELRERHAGPEAAVTIESRGSLADILSVNGKSSEALSLLLRNVDLQGRLDAHGAAMAGVLEALGDHYSRVGEHEPAIAALRRALGLREAIAGEDDAGVLSTLGRIGSALSRARRLEEAEAVLRRQLEGRRRLDGAESPLYAWSLNELGRVLEAQGRGLQALPLFREALAIMARKRGTTSNEYSTVQNNLAFAAEQAGDLATAQAAFDEALAIRIKTHDEKGQANLHHNLGTFLMRQDRLDLARPHLDAALRSRRAAFGEQHAAVAATRLALLEWQVKSGDAAGAVAELEALEALAASFSEAQRATLRRQRALIDALQGKVDAALRALADVEATERSLWGERHPRYWLGRVDRLTLLARRGTAADRVASAALAQEILTALDPMLVPEAPVRGKVRELARSP